MLLRRKGNKAKFTNKNEIPRPSDCYVEPFIGVAGARFASIPPMQTEIISTDNFINHATKEIGQ